MVLKQFMLWMQVSSEHETERAIKRYIPIGLFQLLVPLLIITDYGQRLLWSRTQRLGWGRDRSTVSFVSSSSRRFLNPAYRCKGVERLSKCNGPPGQSLVISLGKRLHDDVIAPRH